MATPTSGQVGGIAADQLRAIIDRLERLEAERKALADDISDIYSESKGNGFCNKTIKKIIAMRRKDSATLDEEQMMLDVYCRAIGMGPDFESDEQEAA
jgi:uncharacterized protein (UPF0335 family)